MDRLPWTPACFARCMLSWPLSAALTFTYVMYASATDCTLRNVHCTSHGLPFEGHQSPQVRDCNAHLYGRSSNHPQPPTRHHAVHSLSHAQQQASRLCAHAGSDASASIGKVANTHVAISWGPAQEPCRQTMSTRTPLYGTHMLHGVVIHAFSTCLIQTHNQYEAVSSSTVDAPGAAGQLPAYVMGFRCPQTQSCRRTALRHPNLTTALLANPHGPITLPPGHTPCACQPTTAPHAAFPARPRHRLPGCRVRAPSLLAFCCRRPADLIRLDAPDQAA